jgi:GMP reductase
MRQLDVQVHPLDRTLIWGSVRDRETVPSSSPRASEGKTVEVVYKGPVDVTIRDVLGGVRSTCTYVGAGKLKELSRRTTFIRVTQQLNTVFGNDN